MFAFSRAVTCTKPLDIRQCAHPLRSFSVSVPLDRSYDKDPTIRRQQMDEFNAYWKEKYHHDEEYRKHRIKTIREYEQAMSDFDRRRLRQQHAFNKWVIFGLKRGARRACPSHTAEYSLTKETRCCTECGFIRNRRLWWKRNDESRLYDVRMTPSAMHGTQDQPLVLSSPARNYVDLAVCLQCSICFVKDWSKVLATGYEYTSYTGRRSTKREQKSDTRPDETSDPVRPATESRP